MKDNKHSSLHLTWHKIMLGYLSMAIICSSKLTVSSEEQIVKDKYPSIFQSQVEAIVFIILQIFFATHAGNWGIFLDIP